VVEACERKDGVEVRKAGVVMVLPLRVIFAPEE
jgi:hypothetical protein